MERRIVVTDGKNFKVEESSVNFFPREGDSYIRGNELFTVLYIISEMDKEEFLTTVYVKRSYTHYYNNIYRSYSFYNPFRGR